MKRLIALLLLSGAICSAEEITLTRSAVIKADHSIVAVKAGTVLELVSRGEKTLTVRYNKITGTIPASSIAPVAENRKKEEPPPAAAADPAPDHKAQTNYGRAVEKAKENAGKHEKNLVKPTDEVLKN